MGVRVKVGFKDSVGVQIGQNFPWGTFGVHGASGASCSMNTKGQHLWQLTVGGRPRGGGGGQG